MSSFLDIASQAARAGGTVLLDWKGRFEAREKAPRDLVTEADLASQQEIRRVIHSAFPDHGFLGEEDDDSGSTASSGNQEGRRPVECSQDRVSPASNQDPHQ